MLILKILGIIDLTSAVALLMLMFGINVYIQFILFCAGLLLIKGIFVFTGDVLSYIDLFSSIILFLSIFFSIPIFLIWIGTFLLFAKGFVSFL